MVKSESFLTFDVLNECLGLLYSDMAEVSVFVTDTCAC